MKLRTICEGCGRKWLESEPPKLNREAMLISAQDNDPKAKQELAIRRIIRAYNLCPDCQARVRWIEKSFELCDVSEREKFTTELTGPIMGLDPDKLNIDDFPTSEE